MRERLAWIIATGCVLLVACASGGDLGTDEAVGGDSGAEAAVQPTDRDAGGGNDSSAVRDTGASSPDTGSSGDDGPSTDDGSTIEEAATTPDSASADTGTTNQPDTGTTNQPDTGTTTGGVCGSDAKYAVEAAAEVFSGTITFCFSGVCGAGQCCYEEANPGNVCVAQ